MRRATGADRLSPGSPSPAGKPCVSWARDGGSPRVDPAAGGFDGGRCGGATCLWLRGIIANRDELVQESGPEPDQDTPGSLLAKLYVRHGLETAHRLEGTCSFVLWDEQERRLVAVTGRTGHHRLYLARTADVVHLAHRVEALLPLLPDRRLDEESVALHLAGRSIPLESTFFSGIRALAPGRILVARRAGISQSTYWRPRLGARLELGSAKEYSDRLWELLQTVVGSYMRAGGVAIALSGGLDSAAVAAAARKAGPAARVAAVRVGFPDLPEADESATSAEVARLLALDEVALSGSRFWPLSRPVAALARPGSPVSLPYTELWQAILACAGDTGSRILMTGSGGDEGIGALVLPYRELLRAGQLGETIRQLRAHAEREAISFPRAIWKKLARPLGGDLLRGMRGRRRSAPAWLARRYRRWIRIPELPDHGRFAPLKGRVKRLQSLVGPALTHTSELLSILAAERGLWVCDPFTDHRLIDFVLALPVTQTFRSGVRKPVLREALRQGLPTHCVDRLGKTVPTPLALRGLREYETEKVMALLTEMKAADLGFVRPSKVRDFYQRFLAGEHSDLRFWPVLTFEAWLREHS